MRPSQPRHEDDLWPEDAGRTGSDSHSTTGRAAPAAPIFMTPRDLEHALDQFLPESPAYAAAAAFGDPLDAFLPESEPIDAFDREVDVAVAPLPVRVVRARPSQWQAAARWCAIVAALVTIDFVDAFGDRSTMWTNQRLAPGPAAAAEPGPSNDTRSLLARADSPLATGSTGDDSPVTVAPARSRTIATAATNTESGSDLNSIHAVLGEYQRAFTDLDSRAAAAVWPTVDRRALDRTFSELSEQAFTFTSCEASVQGVMGSAGCTGEARFVAKAGNRNPRLEPRQWDFRLRKSPDGWVIEDVNAR
jgi:hypothetical protein